MTNADKLKQLIELAWANGWERWKDVKEHMTFRDDHIGLSFSSNIEPETVFFDHNFIKALCKAKYGEYCYYLGVTWDSSAYMRSKGLDIHRSYDASIEEYCLASLALSTDRINYLYGEFCNDK